MAYRVKGIYTKKQRETLSRFIAHYYALVDNVKIDSSTRELAKSRFYPFVFLAQAALMYDEATALWKRIEGGNTK